MCIDVYSYYSCAAAGKEECMRTHEEHTFGPVYDSQSRVLILGSFPSVKSREQGFYYGHPQNRFWKVLAAIYEETVPVTIASKKEFLHRNQIALWDVIESCDIRGSSDSSIQNAVVNDISRILKEAPIEKIITNGKTADVLFRKYIKEQESICLPSTSPANAAWGLERLVEAWKKIIIKDC